MHNKTDIAISSYDEKEERLNVQTHVVGAALAVLGFILLLIKGAGFDLKVMFAFGIYGFSQIMLFSASSLYHSAKNVKTRKRLRILDHASIYIGIAGTYTPFCLYGMSEEAGMRLLTFVWIIAIIGVVFKLFFTGKYSFLSTVFYTVMGGLGLIYGSELIAHVNPYGITLLLGGAVVFFIGAVLYSIKKIPYNHALFHVCVVVASIMHFSSIYFYVSP